jgi:hypothetical protein
MFGLLGVVFRLHWLAVSREGLRGLQQVFSPFEVLQTLGTFLCCLDSSFLHPRKFAHVVIGRLSGCI